jgi:HK97 gp10 family phage protein
VKSFGSLAALAEHLSGEVTRELSATHRGLERAAVAIENTAIAEIGHYQDAVGPFEAWPALADSTEAEKERLGYRLDAPLLRTGDMQGSIKHETSQFEATIGSDDPTMVYHEFGTSKMPPRPVMGPALQRNIPTVLAAVGEEAVAAFVGRSGVDAREGYTLESAKE